MTTIRPSRRTTSMLTIALAAGLLAACGGSDAAEPAASVEPATNSVESADTTASATADDEPAETAAPTQEPSEPPSSGDSNAVLSLANGETYEFSVLCTLEPQMAAGSEILFTATSFGTPALDITQFGDDGTVQGIASVSVYDESYETLWEANSFYGIAGGASVELRLDGNTITGTGAFYPAADVTATPVDGEVVANC